MESKLALAIKVKLWPGSCFIYRTIGQRCPLQVSSPHGGDQKCWKNKRQGISFFQCCGVTFSADISATCRWGCETGRCGLMPLTSTAVISWCKMERYYHQQVERRSESITVIKGLQIIPRCEPISKTLAQHIPDNPQEWRVTKSRDSLILCPLSTKLSILPWESFEEISLTHMPYVHMLDSSVLPLMKQNIHMYWYGLYPQVDALYHDSNIFHDHKYLIYPCQCHWNECIWPVNFEIMPLCCSMPLWKGK